MEEKKKNTKDTQPTDANWQVSPPVKQGVFFFFFVALWRM